MLRKITVFFFALLLSFSGLRAQWQSIAPNLIGQGPYGNQGAMNAAGGVAWAGLHALYKSTDKGLSWQYVSLPKGSNTMIQYISFFDGNTGLVCAEDGVYVTHDQGQTWKRFFSGDFIFAGTFSGSPMAFVVGDATTHFVSFTRDGGSTWANTTLDYVVKDFYSVKPGNVVGFVESTTASYVAITNDYGKTWVKQSGIMEPDAHSFGVMPCDAQFIFGINEEGGNYGQDNSLSEVYLSKDGGVSFRSILSYPGRTLSGCIAITPGVIYIPARSSGILESIDSGATWVTVSGPNLPIDCHDIITIDDTILLAADNVGTIWRNIDPRNASKNSGTPGTLTVSPLSIQFPDSIPPCGPSVSKSVYVTRSCGGPSITGIGFQGTSKDSNYFSIDGRTTGDSIKVTFFPDSGREYSTNMNLTLNNGTNITLPLQGFGKTPQILSVTTSDFFNDTIGATIYVPITTQPSIQYGNLDLSVHFDTSMLIYDGTFCPGSNKDQTTLRGVGSARLHFDQSTVQSVGSSVGYALFRIFPRHTPCTTVLFDSISVTSDKGLVCAIAQPSFSSKICANVICGTASISDFMRYGKFPTITIHPNPSTGTAILHSDLDLGNTKIRIFDQVGRMQFEEEGILNSTAPKDLSFPELPSGIYSVRIESGQYIKYLPLMILH